MPEQGSGFVPQALGQVRTGGFAHRFTHHPVEVVDVDVLSKGRKQFFLVDFLLVDTQSNLLVSCVVAAHWHDGATAAWV